jgi:hypothetical protein
MTHPSPHPGQVQACDQALCKIDTTDVLNRPAAVAVPAGVTVRRWGLFFLNRWREDLRRIGTRNGVRDSRSSPVTAVLDGSGCRREVARTRESWTPNREEPIWLS